MPCPDVVCWVRAARQTSGKTVAAKLWCPAELPAAQKGFNRKLLVPNFRVSNAGILVTVFALLFSKPYL